MIQTEAKNIDFDGLLRYNHLFAKHEHFQFISNSV